MHPANPHRPICPKFLAYSAKNVQHSLHGTEWDARPVPIKIVLVVSVKIYYPIVEKNSRAWLRRGKEEIQALHTQLRYFHGDLSALSYVIRSLEAIIMKIRKRRCNLCASTVN